MKNETTTTLGLGVWIERREDIASFLKYELLIVDCWLLTGHLLIPVGVDTAAHIQSVVQGDLEQ